MTTEKTESRVLTLDEILHAGDLETLTVPVPEWDGAVVIQSMTKAVQQDLRRKAMNGKDLDNDRFEMLLFIQSVIEPTMGEEHYEALRQKSATAIDRVNKAILNLNGISPEAQKEADRSFRDE